MKRDYLHKFKHLIPKRKCVRACVFTSTHRLEISACYISPTQSNNEEIMERGGGKASVKNGKGPVKGVHKQHIFLYHNIHQHQHEEAFLFEESLLHTFTIT